MKRNKYSIYVHSLKQLIIFLLFCFISAEKQQKNRTVFYNYSAINIDGDTIQMSEYKNKKILLVNVASKCGYTSQYKDLQKLHENYYNKLIVLGFPSNDFLGQEPGNNSDIKAFCQREYGITFQMFEKIHVKGKKQHPLYQWLTDDKKNGWNNKKPTWNFCKYLIDEEGNLIEYFGPSINPLDSMIVKHINKKQQLLLPP